MKIKQLLIAALVSTASSHPGHDETVNLKPFSMDAVSIDELPVPDGVNVTFVGPESERRRFIVPLLATPLWHELYTVIKGSIEIAGGLSSSPDDCEVAKIALLPTLQSAMGVLNGLNDGAATALGWDRGKATVYAGFSKEFGFIRSWGHTWGYFLDSDGNHGCFTTECWGWGLMAQGQVGAMAGILFGDHTSLAGPSMLFPDPVPDVGWAGPVAGMGAGTTNPKNLPWWEKEDIEGDEFFEFFAGAGVGVELLKGATCDTTLNMIERKNHVCFDIENKGHARETGAFWWDDEVHEDSKCEICAAQWENNAMSGPESCKIGIYNKLDMDCIEMPETFSKDKPVMITTSCGDMLWIDRIRMHDANGQRDYGEDNDQGWCLSTDKDDYKVINNDDLSQTVTANECFVSLLFTPGSSTAKAWGEKLIGCTYHEKTQCKRNGSHSKHALTQDLCLQKCDETPGCRCVTFRVEDDLPCELSYDADDIEWATSEYVHSFHLEVCGYDSCKNKGKRTRRRIGGSAPSGEAGVKRSHSVGDADVPTHKGKDVVPKAWKVHLDGHRRLSVKPSPPGNLA